MADLTKYLSYEGLSHYDEKLKKFMADEDAKVLKSAKDYTDALENGKVQDNIDAIDLLNDSVDVAGSVKHSIYKEAKDAIYKVDETTEEVTTIAEAIATLDTESKVTVEKLAAAETGYISSYVVKQNGTQVGATINIPKDYLVKSAELKTVEVEDEPVAGFHVGDKYIDFTINTVEGSGNESHVYINVNDLYDSYESGSLATDMVVVNVDNTTNKISASVTAGSITRDRITAGFESDIAKMETALQKDEDGTYKTVSTRIDEEAKDAFYKEVDAYRLKVDPFTVISVEDYEKLPEEQKADYEAVKIEATLGDAIEALEEAVGEGGSVQKQITDAINALDATVEQPMDDSSVNAVKTGLSLKVVEEDGKLVSVEGAIETVTNDDIDALFPVATPDGE